MSSGRWCLLDIGVILSFMELERSRVRIDLALKGEAAGQILSRIKHLAIRSHVIRYNV